MGSVSQEVVNPRRNISLLADGGFVCKLCAESFFGVLGSRGSIFQENRGWTCCNCPAKLSEEGF